MTRKCDSDLVRQVRAAEERAELVSRLHLHMKAGRQLTALGRDLCQSLLKAGWKDAEVSALVGATPQAINLIRQKGENP